jgi:segregation and condensation protein B
MGHLRTGTLRVAQEDALPDTPDDLAAALETAFDAAEDARAFAQACRITEALLFASAEPLAAEAIASRLPGAVPVQAVLKALSQEYASRGVTLVQLGGKWAFRTAEDLAFLLSRETVEPRKLSRAAMETLAIIAYHQPVTRAEIEEIRGVATHRDTLNVLIETGWVRLRGRRRSPGRPVTWGTTEGFLVHFGLNRIDDLPGLDELKGSGLLDGQLPPGFGVPSPSDDPALREDEDPLGEDLFTALAEETANAVEEPLSGDDPPGAGRA